jgi:ABC-type dipeptide/oligopeptide/nickel transport system ATPase subunit
MKTIQIPISNEQNLRPVEIQRNMVIVGANGAGKTRFGSRLEQANSPTKRISAQRYLQLSEVVPNQDYDTSVSQLNSAFKNQQSIQPQNDYIQVLMSLFAEESMRNEEAIQEIKNGGTINKEKLRLSVKEQLLDVWNFIYPDRNLKLIKNKIRVSNGATDFSGVEMSDGEKVGLYLISQILLADADCILILDEPELHLHKALMVRLWNKLEEYRKDCIFIYITHDLDFAVSKNSEKLIWIKTYVSDYVWSWEEIEPNKSIPENLFLEVLGSRKPILFVEGDKGSLDIQLYQAMYDHLTVIPCGSCEKVIEAVKGIRVHPQSKEMKIFGMIDKDFRPAAQLESFSRDGIFNTQVNKIENLFLLPEVIEMVCENQAQINKHEAVISEIKKNYENHRTSIEFKSAKYQVQRHINEKMSAVKNSSDYMKLKESLFEELDNLFDTAISPNLIDIIEILKYYPNKGLVHSVQGIIDLTNDGYKKIVLGFLSSNKKHKLISILKRYLPEIEMQNPPSI